MISKYLLIPCEYGHHDGPIGDEGENADGAQDSQLGGVHLQDVILTENSAQIEGGMLILVMK